MLHSNCWREYDKPTPKLFHKIIYIHKKQLRFALFMLYFFIIQYKKATNGKLFYWE